MKNNNHTIVTLLLKIPKGLADAVSLLIKADNTMSSKQTMTTINNGRHNTIHKHQDCARRTTTIAGVDSRKTVSS